MPKAKVFSLLDANHDFWEVKLAKDSSEPATFNTPSGRYSYRRLPFGIAIVPEVFQNVCLICFRILKVLKLLRIIMMCGKTLFQTMESSMKQGLYGVGSMLSAQPQAKQTGEKCHFRVSRVCHVGHMFRADGVEPDSQEDEAINTMPILKTYGGFRALLARYRSSFQKSALLR